MTAVSRHVLAIDEPHASHQGTDYGQLKDQSHYQTHPQQRIDIRLQRQHIGHIGRYLIRAQKADRKGKYDEVVDQRTDDEHQIGGSHNPHGIAAFVLVESW